MAVPAKYRQLGDFHEYYSGARTAPYLTIFVAGNHEASSHLWELYYGGWVAPNIYYLGAANVVRLGPLRIAGVSGIWKGFDYRKPHFERLPFNADDIRSFYHVRELDVRKLLQLRTQVDIGISHDWPRAIEKHGNMRHLFNMKPDFERESHDGSLGNPAAAWVMDRLRPPYWFSAHLHCKFTAIKEYTEPSGPEPAGGPPADPPSAQQLPKAAASAAANPDEIDLDFEQDEADAEPQEEQQQPDDEPDPTGTLAAADDAATEVLRAQLPDSFAKPVDKPARTIPGQPVPPGITNKTVRFLALDKCLFKRKFLQLCEITPINRTDSSVDRESDTRPRYRLQYDPEWLAITRAFAPFLTIGDRAAATPPDLGEAHYRALIEAEEAWVRDHIIRTGKLTIPDNFVPTAPPHVPGQPEITHEQPDEYTNPQTEAFCALVGVPNLWAASDDERRARKASGPVLAEYNSSSSSRGGGRGGARGRGGGRGRGRGRGGGGGGGRGRGGGRGGGVGRGRGGY